ATRTTLVPSAFYSRFTPELAELMRSLVLHAFEELSAKPAKWCKALAAFKDVFITDGSLIRLDDALQSDYPSVWTNHTKASVKLISWPAAHSAYRLNHGLLPARNTTRRLSPLGPGAKEVYACSTWPTLTATFFAASSKPAVILFAVFVTMPTGPS